MPALFLAFLAVVAVTPAPLEQLLASRPADSLPGPLARYEASQHGDAAADAALLLGRLHYARGEYRQAAADFARATPRFDAARRAEARYWAGLAWLGAGEVGQAHAAFDEAARSGSQRRAGALLGVAECWESERRPEKALEALLTLLAADPGEAGPAALEREAALAAQLVRPELARRARERLAEEYPRSMEALRAALAPATRAVRPAARVAAPVAPVAPPPPALQAPLTVQIGAFREPTVARGLAERARRAGFSPVRVPVLEDAGAALYAVRVGVYATAGDARSAGERLGRALGVAWRVVPAP